VESGAGYSVLESQSRTPAAAIHFSLGTTTSPSSQECEFLG
jgi:hypothetical protein